MRKLAGVLLFIVIEVLLLPVTLIGGTWYLIKLLLTNRRLGLSNTAYDALLGRWILHELGARADDACRRVVLSLPAISPAALRMTMGPTFLAARLSGYCPSMMAYPAARPSTRSAIVNQRTEFFDNAIQDRLEHMGQLVILGAGWDTRAYNLPEGAGASVFEVDTTEMQTVKRAALQTAGIDTAHVRFVTADFNKEPWTDSLKRSGFDPAVPTFFLWEGVVHYLEEEAVHATLDAIGSQLANGSVIAFDYPSRELVEGSGSPLFRLAVKSLQMMGEPWRFGISTRPPARKQVANLLEAHGLELERFESWGEESGKRTPFGGMAVVVSPTRPTRVP